MILVRIMERKLKQRWSTILDLHIHLKLSGFQGGCMSMPFQVKPEKQDNFTFRQKRAGLIMGRPTFSNKFNSLQPFQEESMDISFQCFLMHLET
jgi:hypothetical protein